MGITIGNPGALRAHQIFHCTLVVRLQFRIPFCQNFFCLRPLFVQCLVCGLVISLRTFIDLGLRDRLAAINTVFLR